MTKERSVTVTVMGVDVVCFYDALKGSKGDRDDPPSDPYCEVWKTVIGGVELDMDHLNEKFMDAITEAVEERVFDPEDYYDPEDDADFWGPDR